MEYDKTPSEEGWRNGQDLLYSFPATAITEHVRNGGLVENVRNMSAQASSGMTNMYSRIDSEMKVEEVQRVRI